MATKDQIFSLRIALNDPEDIIEIQSIPDETLLPTVEVPQVLYYDEARNVYWQAKRGSSPATYSIARLTFSDARINEIVDAVGVEMAECKLLELKARSLGNQLAVIKTQVGSDVVQKQSIDSMYKYYKGLAQGCRDEVERANAAKSPKKSGGMFKTKRPIIAGGLV